METANSNDIIVIKHIWANLAGALYGIAPVANGSVLGPKMNGLWSFRGPRLFQVPCSLKGLGFIPSIISLMSFFGFKAF